MTDGERIEAMITARLLGTGRIVDWLGTGLTLVAAGALLLGSVATWPAIGVILLGLVAKYFAVRVCFDAKLFRDVARERLSTEAFDAAMRHLGLLPGGKGGRGWTERCKAARGLLARQVAVVALQSLVAALAAFLQ